MQEDTATDSPRESVATASPVAVAAGVLSAHVNMSGTLAHSDGTNSIGVNTMQLPSTELGATRLQRENEDLKAQLQACEARFTNCQQVIDVKQAEIDEKNQLIAALQMRLSRLTRLAAAVTDEVHGAQSVVSGVSVATFQPSQERELLTLKQEPQQEQQSPAAVPLRVDLPLPEQQSQLNLQQHLLTLFSQLAQKPQNATTAGAAAAVETTAAANARLPSAGTKRSRLCSATGSGGDPFKLHAASGGSGSSSSRQQLSAGEELDEDIGCDEADCEEATAGCHSAKRQRSAGSTERMHCAEGQHQQEQHEAPVGDQIDAEQEDDKSQDDLDAAQCLQQLAMSAAEQNAAPGVHMPTMFESLNYGERFAASKSAPSASNLARWGSNGINQAATAAGAAVPGYAGSCSSNASGGAIGPTYDALHAQIMSYLQNTVNPSGFDVMRQQPAGHQMQQQQHKKFSSGYVHQQQRQLHQYNGTAPGGAPKRESSAGGGSWTPNGKSVGAAAGAMGAPARARKQSWFQTEIAEKIPVSVQQACKLDWAAQHCMQVVCADLYGTFYVNSGDEYLIKLANSGEVVTPNKFEELAGKKTARNWQQSIRLVGYTMNGEPNSALLKLGHFTRIVGLVNDR